MAKTICGWCGVNTHMTHQGTAQLVELDGHGSSTEQAFRCDDCGRMSVGLASGLRIAHVNDGSTLNKFWNEYTPDVWAPRYVRGQNFENVPDHIARAASEAHKVRSIDALMSAVLMARTVVEATAKEKGITTGQLVKKIELMAENGIIKEFTRDTAHVIRAFGNDMAHGDISLPLDADDADGVLEFMDELLSEVFQNPAKLAKLKAAAEARKKRL